MSEMHYLFWFLITMLNIYGVSTITVNKLCYSTVKNVFSKSNKRCIAFNVNTIIVYLSNQAEIVPLIHSFKREYLKLYSPLLDENSKSNIHGDLNT
jgi:hypothetical protein